MSCPPSSPYTMRRSRFQTQLEARGHRAHLECSRDLEGQIDFLVLLSFVSRFTEFHSLKWGVSPHFISVNNNLNMKISCFLYT